MIKEIKTAEKIVLCGKIQNLTPLIIGSGKKDHTDIDILVDPEGTPFIPATSFLGVLRHAFSRQEADNKNQFDLFWGSSNTKQSLQSSVRCSDLFPVNNGEPVEIRIRDGVKIDSSKGMAEDKEKYDFQLLEKGSWFSLRVEITVREDQKEYCRKMALCFKTILESREFSIGSGTGNGFGQMGASEIKIMIYDFTRGCQDIYKWLNNQEGEDATAMLKKKYPDAHELCKSTTNFILNARFKLKSSLLINSGYSDEYNAAHIMSRKTPALPGTSVKGVARARAAKIVNTLLSCDKQKSLEKSADLEHELIKQLFGFVASSDSKQNPHALRSRLIVEEKYLPEYNNFEHYRIRVDRFTGGVINGALFSALPIGPPKPEKNSIENALTLTIKIIDCKNYEAGLILLVLKDLWSGDCAIGSGKAVGRGILQGLDATITFDGDQVCMQDLFQNISFSEQNKKLKQKKDLQELIQTLFHTITKEDVCIQEAIPCLPTD